MRHLAGVLLAAVACAVAAPLALAAQSASADSPLTRQQVEDGLKILAPRRLAALLRARGATFILDEGDERRLRAANPAKGDAAAIDEIVRLLAPPRNPSTGADWVAPTDRRRMMWIPAGTFLMGSPPSEKARDADELSHPVTLAAGFWMDATEVTNRAFQRFVIANPEWQKNRIDRTLHDGNYLADWKGVEFPPGKGDAPVVYVSWYAARAYAAWIEKHLPTEAQWEYACRAGTRTTYWWGDSFEAAPPGGLAGTARNPWGLLAMIGGVWEWTSTLYRNYPFAEDGRSDNSATGPRVTRGGATSSGGPMLRSANRNSVAPITCNDTLGFRCVL